LGGNVGYVPMIAEGMGRFAPRIFRGVRHTEGRLRLT
jgi:hypothetical protein